MKYIIIIFSILLFSCSYKEYKQDCRSDYTECKKLSCLECMQESRSRIASNIQYWNRTNGGILSGDTYRESRTYKEMYEIAKLIECPQCDKNNEVK
jgi:hypothetical protein